MFIMNFKEIHSNTEFLSTYRRAGACSCLNIFQKETILKFQGHRVLEIFGVFCLLLGGSTYVQHPSQKTKFISLSQHFYNLIFISNRRNNLYYA